MDGNIAHFPAPEPAKPSLSDRRRQLKVNALHLAKCAVQLTASIHTMAEHLGDDSGLSAARFDVEAVDYRVMAEAIRRELDAIDAILATSGPEAA